MKTTVTSLVCAAAIGVGSYTCSAAENQNEPSVVTKAADAVIVRPLGFTSVLVGSALFTVSLPVTAILKKVKPTADLLVVKPAKATFKRPLGDIDAMAD